MATKQTPLRMPKWVEKIAVQLLIDECTGDGPPDMRAWEAVVEAALTTQAAAQGRTGGHRQPKRKTP